MTVTFLAPDGVPITAQQFRQAQAATYGGGAGRPLGGRSGFRIDTPATVLAASSTTWTLGPCSAMIDPGASTHQGMYGWSSDSNVTGAITAADATYARKDIVYIQVNDSSSGDGSGALSAPVLYLAGTASASPATPALPGRSFLVGTITVPQAGGGSPTTALNPARFSAAGAPLPVSSQVERDALSLFDGLTVRRLDIAGRPTETYDATATTWSRPGVTQHAEWTGAPNGLAPSTVYNLCALGIAPVAGQTTDAGFVTSSSTGLTIRDAGTYAASITSKWSTTLATGARAFVEIADSAGTTSYARASFGNTEDTTTLSLPNFKCAAGTLIRPQVFQTSGVLNLSSTIRITRIG